jgi:Protoglobin
MCNEKLLSYDATARHFVPRQSGFTGPLPDDVSTLTQISPPIQFRKEHLSRYFMQLLGRAYDDKMTQYLDMVGKIHTPLAGNKAIDVPQVQMNALMGLLADTLTETILQQPLDAATILGTLRAFQKLLWIQNDFIHRHYSNGQSS